MLRSLVAMDANLFVYAQSIASVVPSQLQNELVLSYL